MRTILIFLFLPLFSSSQSKFIPMVDSLMTAQAQIREFNGNVLIAQSGKILYQKSFGYRNYEKKQLLDSNSVFELASVSKQFTAMSILLLKEQGKLRLNDSLRKFFPQLPYANITIHQMLVHTSGLPDYFEVIGAKWDHSKVAFNKDMIRLLAAEKTPARFEAGTKWEYSNTAYALLASIIEQVSGTTYNNFLQEQIFKQLSMTSTRVYNTRRSSTETIPNYAYGHVYSESLKQYFIPDSIEQYRFVYYLDGITGDGTVNSTTSDLLKWDRALKSNRLLPEITQKEMFSSLALADTVAGTGYGYGVVVQKTKFGKTLFHSGGWPGYVTMLHRDVEDDITIIVLSNNNSNSPAIATQLSFIMHDEPVILPYVHKEVAIDTSILDNYVGKYRGANVIQLVKENGKLYKKGVQNLELKPESDRKFFFNDRTDRQIEFVLNESGKPEHAYLINNGIKTELNKVD